ncbi:hypothetical protein PAXRUDRAFT_828121 [Paxillus rubicundulus Ve08.2h10]|uniref:Transmembrane protein n=1 Tax=Paxillus rubicundulus Ve08.2h10 TaxID=930991 RepID=A0A0D0E1P8_9AGAM|nr:hypothetical protein PAXRUDRAFT_828121 [Paxillus rubicundulus Ve08.2h10]
MTTNSDTVMSKALQQRISFSSHSHLSLSCLFFDPSHLPKCLYFQCVFWSLFVSASAGSFGAFVLPPSWLSRRVSARSRAQKVRPLFFISSLTLPERFSRIPSPTLLAQTRDL